MNKVLFVRNKKAQIAMEFLMTYGWALLALAVIIVALFFIGVRDIERFIPDKCEFLSGFNCLDVQVVESENVSYPSNINFVLLNEIGFDISDISITLDGTCNSVMNLTGEIAPTALLNKEQGTFSFPCPNLTGVDIEEKISFRFTNTETDVVHNKVGYIDLKQ